ncbi:hypothetical protein PthstB1num2_37790 [Parageobacillus thermoglucosidasius]|nr:hypothetical protein PthstB1num2_37790 [Parageobacillus thermoglucosidasius]
MSYSLGYDLSYYAEVIVEYLLRYRGMRSSPNYCVNSPLIDNMDLMT